MEDITERVSIIIPACNSEATIERCISSIYNNNYSDIECVVVINNSTDATSAVCHSLQLKYKRIIVIDSKSKGVSSARNEGIQQSTGSILGFCDADDYYEPHAIDSIIRQFLLSSADLIVTGFNCVEENEQGIVKHRYLKSNSNQMITVRKAQGLFLNDPLVMGTVWNKFYKRHIMSNARFDEHLTHSEDTHYNIQILNNSNISILLSNIITYNYIISSNTATGSIDRCYTEDNKLKYLIAFEKIQREYANSKHIVKETSYSLASLSIDNYHHSLSASRKANLRIYVKKYIFYIVTNVFKYNLKRNVKRIIKGGLILLKVI